MISVHGSAVAHLGGWRGDRLALGGPGAPFRVLVAELGWDKRAQVVPQRRIVLRADELLVLEPAKGPLLQPPLRVRRFDLDGRELGQEEGGAESADADLCFQAEPAGPGRFRVVRTGIGPAGRPVAWEGEIAFAVRRKRKGLSGTPLRQGGVWWYPIRMEGLYRVEGDAVARFGGEPGGVVEVRGRATCAGARGVWVDGAWRRFPGGRLRPAWRPPLGVSVAALGERGLVGLRSEGGDLPVLDGPPARLPPGRYSDLVTLADGLFALADEDPPRLEPVRF